MFSLADEEIAEIYFSLKSFRGGRKHSLSARLSRSAVNFVMMNYAANVVPKIVSPKAEILAQAGQIDSNSTKGFLVKRDLAEKPLSKLEM